MKAIVAVDNNWGIGLSGGLLFRLKEDMAFFRRTTLGKVVVMGAKTYQSFPHGALPDRINIVLDDSGKSYSDALSVSDIPSLLQSIGQYNADDVFVIGGASVYKQLLDLCDEAFVTKVDACGNADVFFPDLDANSHWRLAEQSDPVPDSGYTVRFCRYVNENR